MKAVLFVFGVCLLSLPVAANNVRIFRSKIKWAARCDLAAKPINELVAAVAESFRGTVYKADTLEGEGEELRINLAALDCYTLIETSLALARTIKSGSCMYADFRDQIRKLRYRNGVMQEYPSRLHYFSDWIHDLQKRSIAADITQELGGIEYRKTIDYMSNHPQAYAALRNNPTHIERIKGIENLINNRNYFYIPQDNIENIEDKVKTGYIIGITTNIRGLDIIHAGVAVEEEDRRMYLLHASSRYERVKITPIPLADYLERNERQTGIMVVKPL